MDPEKFALGNPFVGDPRAELDDAWDTLLRSMSSTRLITGFAKVLDIQIRVDPGEFSQLQPQLNRTSLRLPNGSFIIRFEVYHQLHCLKWIRKWIHRDHYWPNISGYELHERRWHIGMPCLTFSKHLKILILMVDIIEHCLEGFRLGATCDPSLAPSTFHFVDRTASDEITANGNM
jgi:hypothetical protein